MSHGLNLFSFLFFIFAISCNPVTNPKPRGYFRIDFPEKKYTLFNSNCPFIFSYPVYASVSPYPDEEKKSLLRSDSSKTPELAADINCWMNIEFPVYKATIHCSYHEIRKNLSEYLEDAHSFAYQHAVRADAISEKVVKRDDKKVYGIIYELQGNAASNMQFFLTDSIHHFARGALYFNIAPQRDSLEPVVDFIQKDIYYLIESWEWKNTN